jgi:hypothetical protein
LEIRRRTPKRFARKDDRIASVSANFIEQPGSAGVPPAFSTNTGVPSTGCNMQFLGSPSTSPANYRLLSVVTGSEQPSRGSTLPGTDAKLVFGEYIPPNPEKASNNEHIFLQ